MGNIIVSTKDSSLQVYEDEWLKNEKDSFYSTENLSLIFYTSMVYGFAKHLPYSMDIEQPEYVPADFYNMEPLDVDTNDWFKWDDRRTFFNTMVNGSETFRTGMLLQMCAIFQKMLLGQFPHDFELEESDYVDWGIDVMTRNMDYNREFFEMLKSLPMHYKNVVNATTNDERRKCLDEMYEEIMYRISSRVGGFRETYDNGNIVNDFPATIPLWPDYDVSLIVYSYKVRYYDGIASVIKKVKREQLKKYQDGQYIGIESFSSIKR